MTHRAIRLARSAQPNVTKVAFLSLVISDTDLRYVAINLRRGEVEILAIIGGLVALLFVLKLLLFISNKLYLEKMLDSLREQGDFQAVAWFESVTSGERGQDMASAAWRAIIQFKSLGIDPATAAQRYKLHLDGEAW